MTRETDWIFWILLFAGGIVASLHYYSPRAFANFQRTPFSPGKATADRSYAAQSGGFSFLTEILFYITFPLFLSYALHGREQLVHGGWIPYSRMIIGSLLFFLTQSAMVYGISWVFNSKDGFTRFQTQKNAIRNWLSLVFIPLLILGIYSPLGHTHLWVIISGVVIGIIYISGVLIASREIRKAQNISVLHIILYLCTLEIGPLLVLVKLFIS